MERRDLHSGRQPYVTPRLRPIELVTDEVLGSGCKNGATAGPELTACTQFPSSCASDGS